MVRSGRIYLLAVVFLLGAMSAHSQNITFACSVENCLACSAYNFCGACQPNFMLSINSTTGMTYCDPIPCNVSNCTYCLGPNQCEQCVTNNHLTPNGSCVHTSIFSRPAACNMTGCLTCNKSSDTICEICQYGFTLSNGECIQDVNSADGSCQVFFNPAMCQVCVNPLQNMVTPTYSCKPIQNFTCNVTGCDYCSSNNTCSQCLPLHNSANGACQAKLCNITGCTECFGQNICIQCEPEYLVSDGSCVPYAYACNVENCLYCEGPEQCGECAQGYYPTKVFSQRYQTQISYCSDDF